MAPSSKRIVERFLHRQASTTAYVALTRPLPQGSRLVHQDRLHGSPAQATLEQIFEEVRAREFPHRPSRLTCIFGAPTLQAVNMWKRSRPFLHEVQVEGNYFVTNSELWTLAGDHTTNRERVESIATDYWKGRVGYAGSAEMLVDGTVTVKGAL